MYAGSTRVWCIGFRMGCQAAARPQRRDSVACIAYPATLAVANVQGSHHHRGVKGIIMPPTITSDVVVAYAQCPRKAYLLLYSPEQGQPHAYVRILEQQRRENHARYLDRLKHKHTDVPPYTAETMRHGSAVLLNACLQADGLAARCDVLSRGEEPSSGGRHWYEPTLCVGPYSISTEQKLAITFTGYVLGRLQPTPPMAGRLIAMDGTAHTVTWDKRATDLMPLLDPIQAWITDTSPEPPPIVLNKHCPLCPFQSSCHAQAEQEDTLTLLHGVTARVKRQYEKKGIFTVKQLSYLFKPRKRKKRSRKLPPVTHKLELQALAIRENTIYLQELPPVSRRPVELFLDMEGSPDRALYYLIGVLVCQAETLEPYAFWANTVHDERYIWQQFVDQINQYSDAPIYHYGSYEPRAIAILAKRYHTDVEPLLRRLVNVHQSIYGKVYFPVRSNGLKDIGHFIGVKWTSSDASGLQSLVWRHQWDTTQDAIYRELLVTYNKEDCYALKLLVDELAKMQHTMDTVSAVHYANQYKQQISEAGQYVHSQFKEILKFAHFEYDEKKIRFRLEFKEESREDKTDRYRRKAEKRYQMLADIRYRTRKIITVSPDELCPQCHHKPLKQPTLISRRYIIDLVPTRNGLKKTITQYAGTQGYCPKCHRNYAPERIRQYQRNKIYGHGFGAWVVYQRVALRLPYESIIESLTEQFSETLSISQPIRFLKQYAEYYAETEKSITAYLLRSPYIHADETKVNIKGTNWYVWVFTDEKHVIFKLTETREATIAHELLHKYQGTLVSDFYPGYDAVKCKQQKCWVHLIRDLNDDLQANPMDREYEEFILEVRNLIVPNGNRTKLRSEKTTLA